MVNKAWSLEEHPLNLTQKVLYSYSMVEKVVKTFFFKNLVPKMVYIAVQNKYWILYFFNSVVDFE